MNLDHKQLDRLLATLADSDIQEFCLEGKDFRLEVKRNLSAANQSASLNSSSSRVENNQSSATLIVESAFTDASQSPSSPPPVVSSSKGDSVEITSPMVGTFYRAPAPGEPSFVEVGSRIGVGQTVCILEAM